MLIRSSHWALAAAVAVAGFTAYAQSKPDDEFTERYGPRTQDTGHWTGSAKIPPGWVLTRGDGTPGTNADWATLMHQVDLVAFGFWRPGFDYPSLGLWELGIDNIHVGTLH